jgi:hypothetical protein
MRKETKWLIAKIVLIVILLGLFLFKDRSPEAISIAVSIVMAMLLITFLKSKNPERYKSDERLEKLSSRATAWSWTLTLILVTVLYWLQSLEYIALTGTGIITLVFFVMVISQIWFRIYFFKKGMV